MRRPRGFTLVELLIALGIVGLLLTIAFSGLRVAMAAWTRGEDRAEAHQHVRAIAFTMARALGAAYPYRAAKGEAPEVVMLFNGVEQKLEFVTEAPPLPLQAPVAFTAVVISLESGEEQGLVVRERALPNRDPFTKGDIVMRDPAVTSLAFKFQTDDAEWVDTWDGQDQKAIPRAISLTIGTTLNGKAQTLPPITVTLRTTGAIR
ncbi:MAG TPA: prepilin-type N-terminal cleavage/methylation domain-containing protein [Methylomirabilota bacterium]|jgi:general secretion pathway protein J